MSKVKTPYILHSKWVIGNNVTKPILPITYQLNNNLIIFTNNKISIKVSPR
jgi:hypothetical protein